MATTTRCLAFDDEGRQCMLEVDHSGEHSPTETASPALRPVRSYASAVAHVGYVIVVMLLVASCALYVGVGQSLHRGSGGGLPPCSFPNC